MKYLHILIFLMTHDLTELKEFWRVEFMKTEKEFRWISLLKGLKININKFMFLYRLAYVMKRSGNNKQKRIADRIYQRLRLKYTVDIALNAEIGIGLMIYHYSNIVISGYAKIGKNFTIMQGVTIGQKGYALPDEIHMNIGNNVTVGANSVIVGGMISIGDKVNIGALSFINTDIPSNCNVFTEKKLKIIK